MESGLDELCKLHNAKKNPKMRPFQEIGFRIELFSRTHFAPDIVATDFAVGGDAPVSLCDAANVSKARVATRRDAAAAERAPAFPAISAGMERASPS